MRKARRASSWRSRPIPIRRHVDPSFGQGGFVFTGFGHDRVAEVTGLALQGNDRIVAAGFAVAAQNGKSDFAFARYEW